MGLKYLLLFAVVMMAEVKTNETEVTDYAKEIGKSTQQFAARVYQEVAKTKSGNFLICPMSVQTVLALVQAGADGDTFSEISSALNLPTDKSVTQQGFQKLMEAFNSYQQVELSIANRVFIKDGVTIAPTFNEIATKNFQAGVENIDFKKNTAAANHINEWVEHKTKNKIKNLISPDDISDDTIMVLVNALYFIGKWKEQFATYATRKEPFYLNENDSVNVDMMHQTSFFRYAENNDLDCKFLEMDYEGSDITMTIVLPNSRTGLPALEKRLTEVLKPQEYSTTNVDLALPKFTIQETIHFNDILQNMGMKKAFSNDADFKGLIKDDIPMKISKVIQKNFINVTEEGTEAASATAVGIATLSLPLRRPNRVPLKVDHPFVFILQTRDPNVHMFVGRILQP